MDSFKKIDRNPTMRTLVSFALTLAAGAGLFGLYAHFHGKPALATNVWIAGGAAAALALVRPIGRWLYVAWMGLGVALGMVTSPIILGILYLVLFTPVALAFRIAGRDKLRLKKDKSASYWEAYPEPEDPATYVKQY